MRKVVGGNRSLAVETGQHQQDNTLGLMHLRKLFADFRQTQNATQKELEEKLYCMLPLFCKVCVQDYSNCTSFILCGDRLWWVNE